MNLSIMPDIDILVDTAATRFTAWAQDAVTTHGRFTVALSGGSTPRKLYTRLASPEFSGSIPWNAVHLFWGDERCVPPEHADSNYRMVAESLLANAPIPAENIHRIQGELSPERAAACYVAELREFLGAEPVFDLVLLGMGDDGHTASLFADSPALTESVRWAVDVDHTNPPPPLVSRVTLTFWVLNAARRVVFLVSGEGKAHRLAQILRGGTSLPAERIQPKNGELLWLVDKSAAAELKGKTK
jgi:6-phosphogluconolactonase